MNKENILAEIIALLSRASDEKKIEVLKVLNDEDIPQKNSFPVFYTLKEAGKKIGVSDIMLLRRLGDLAIYVV